MVEEGPTFPEAVDQFVAWYQGHGLSPEVATFVTCGQWDLVTCLPAQASYSNIPIPWMLDLAASGAFVNVKYSYQNHTGKYGKGLKEMQYELGLQFDGRHHSGLVIENKRVSLT